MPKKLWNLIQFSIFLDMLCGLRETNNLIAALAIVTFYELLACVNELWRFIGQEVWITS